MSRRTYDDDYNRDPRGPSRREDPRYAAVPAREDRHGRDRVETRERTRVVDDRMDVREARDPRLDARAGRDTMIDPRIQPARGDPRANTGTRRAPIPTDRLKDPRGREPDLYRDSRTGQLYDASGRLYDSSAADLYQYPVGRPVYRDDPMDRDDSPHPPRRQREVVESYNDRERGGKYNDFFLERTGLYREVIQHEICRYLGNDATVRTYKHKDVGY